MNIEPWFTVGCERLYSRAPTLEFFNGRELLQVSTYGFDQWMVWSPGQEGATSLVDLPLDGHLEFLCIEPVIVDRPNCLCPGGVFSGGLSVARSVDNQKKMNSRG